MEKQLKQEIIAIASSILAIHLFEHHKEINPEELREWYGASMAKLTIMMDSEEANDLINKIGNWK